MSNNTEEKKQAASSSSPRPAGEEQKPAGPPKSVFRDYFESFVVTLIMALFGMTFVLQAVTVPTASMENTILVGDYLLVNKFIFSPGDTLSFLPQREIKRGDIIVFKYPGNSRHPENDRMRNPPLRKYEINYVKRVVGLPGETIEFRNNQLFINGQLLPEHRVQGDHPTRRNSRQQNPDAPLETENVEEKQADQAYDVYYGQRSSENVKKGLPEERDFEFAKPGTPFKIPDDSYFVMGDNRDNSEDSRFWGPVKRDLIIGRAMFVYWSCDQTESQSMLNCVTHPRFDRIFKFIK
jgi:signal peptidase I